MHEKKHRIPTHVLYKIFIYVALIALAISIIVPVAWGIYGEFEEECRIHWSGCKSMGTSKTVLLSELCSSISGCKNGRFLPELFHCDSAGSCTSSDPGSSGILCAGTL